MKSPIPPPVAATPDEHRQALGRAEEALRLSEERLRMAVEASGVGIWDWDIVADRVAWSDRVYRMHGLAPGSDTGGLAGFRERIHPEDRQKVLDSMAAALAGGPPYNVEFRTRLKDGGTRWIATQGHLVRDADGKPLRMVGASTDVTARNELLRAEREARAQAEAARRRLELLARAGAEHARSLDPQDTLQAIARTLVPAVADWCRIDVIDRDGALQRGLAYHVDSERAQRALAMARRVTVPANARGSMASVLSSGMPHYGNYESMDASANPVLYEFTQAFGLKAHFIIPLVARGHVIGVMAIIQAESGRDLSEEDRALIEEMGQRAALALDNARLYAEAEAARREAENANRAKDEFLAMLGHELRNPLAPIATTLELMARRAPEVAVEERRVIGRQVTHLSRLIDDLLDISRITQGKIQLRRESVDLREVIAHALELTRPLYGQHQYPVEASLPDGAAIVDGDAVRLAQIVGNLLVNAAKFTPRDGRVTLQVRRAGDSFEIAVQDSGCGIAPELLPRVFDLFVQGRQPIDRSTGGLGLGLAIVRSLVDLHSGEVLAESGGVGQGSRFVVRLPAGTGEGEGEGEGSPPADAPVAPVAGAGRLLVVDDNQDAAATLAELLRMSGYDVRTAGDALQALAVVEEFAPALALLDIGLPGIDGYELAAMLRAKPGCRDMKLVALTGYGRENDRARAVQASFDDHLVKPVEFNGLLTVLSALLGAR